MWESDWRRSNQRNRCPQFGLEMKLQLFNCEFRKFRCESRLLEEENLKTFQTTLNAIFVRDDQTQELTENDVTAEREDPSI